MRLCRFRAAVLVLACLLLPAAGYAAADAGSWEPLFDALHKQSTVLHERINQAKARRQTEAAELQADMEPLIRERTRLVLWQASADDPWEIRDAIQGLSSVKTAVDRLRQRPEQFLAVLDQYTAGLETFRERLGDALKDNISPDFRAAIEPRQQEIARLSAELAALHDTTAAEIAPLREFSQQLEASEKHLEAELAPAWKRYYLTVFPSLFTPDVLQIAKDYIADFELWSGLLAETLDTAHSRSLWLQGLVRGLLAAIMVLAGGALSVRYLARKLALPRHGRMAAYAALACAAAGFFFVFLANSINFFLYAMANSLGEILLAGALVHLNRLRPPDPDRPAVLWPLWRLFALGLMIEAVRVPELFVGPVLAAVLLLSAWRFARRCAATPRANRLDRALTRAFSLLLPLLALVALWGLPQTAVLSVSTLFYTALALRFAALTIQALGRLEATEHPGRGPLVVGVLSGVGFPVVFLLYLAAFLWLLSSQFGGEGVFLEALSAEAKFESIGISLKKVATLLAGFYVTKATLALACALIGQMATRRRGLNKGATASLLTINNYVWWGAFLLFALSVLGLSLNSIAWVAGGLSVGIGFGMQNTVNNFVSGLILLFGRSIQAGDTIQIGDTQGVVKEVNIRNTEVLTTENAALFVPNAELLSGKIINWSHKDPSVRRDIAVGVAYGSDTVLVKKLLLSAAASHPFVLGNPEPAVLHWDFGSSTLDFRLRIWLKDIDGAITAVCEVREAIDRLFREHGIEIAFPQNDVHLRTAPALDRLLVDFMEQSRAGLSALTRRLEALEEAAQKGGDRD